MSISMAIVLIVIIALVYFITRRKASAPDKRPAAARPSKSAATTEFHAVSLKFRSSACSAAKSLKGKRFLSNAAPRVPLADCDVLECKCRFVHHRDRRAGDERRDSYSQGFGGETGKHPIEQRKRQDRREDSDPF
jgi:hypothetical protein